jgi:DNA-binding XRE family transcriptional regulator
MTQAQLSKTVGVSRSLISTYENNHAPPPSWYWLSLECLLRQRRKWPKGGWETLAKK